MRYSLTRLLSDERETDLFIALFLCVSVNKTEGDLQTKFARLEESLFQPPSITIDFKYKNTACFLECNPEDCVFCQSMQCSLVQ